MSQPENYMGLPYSIVLTPSPDGGWLAKILELPGCLTFGDTQEEVLELIEDAKLTWLAHSLEMGDPIPEPQAVS